MVSLKDKVETKYHGYQVAVRESIYSSHNKKFHSVEKLYNPVMMRSYQSANHYVLHAWTKDGKRVLILKVDNAEGLFKHFEGA